MTTVIFPTIWLSQWVVSSLFEIIVPIWMFQSLFSLSLHYHRLISIDCSYYFSHYCSISIIVLVIHKYGIIWYRILFELAFQWFETKLMSPFIHILLSLLLFISFPFLFQTLTLNSFSFSYYQSTILMSIYITNFIVVAILFCLVVCWKWIDNSIQNRHRFNPSIMHSRDKNKRKWLDERMIEYTISL